MHFIISNFIDWLGFTTHLQYASWVEWSLYKTQVLKRAYHRVGLSSLVGVQNPHARILFKWGGHRKDEGSPPSMLSIFSWTRYFYPLKTTQCAPGKKSSGRCLGSYQPLYQDFDTAPHSLWFIVRHCHGSYHPPYHSF